jgi:hypothetical protein
MEMVLKIYRNGEQINEIKSTDKGEIFEHVARIYRQKLDKLADRVEIVANCYGIERATIYAHFDMFDGHRQKYKYVYTFDGVRL